MAGDNVTLTTAGDTVGQVPARKDKDREPAQDGQCNIDQSPVAFNVCIEELPILGLSKDD